MKKLQSLFLGILIIIAVLLLGVRQLEKTSGMSGAKVPRIVTSWSSTTGEIISILV